jgi:hypothetical protein
MKHKFPFMPKEFQDRATSADKDSYQRRTKQTRIAKLLDDAARFNIYHDSEVKRLLDDFSKMPNMVPDTALEYLEKLVIEKGNERKRYPFTNAKAMDLNEDIKIGRELQSRKLVGINPDKEMVRHMYAAGESGSTKTSFATTMILNMLAYRKNSGKKIGIIIPDIKGDYTGLARIDDENILVIDPSGLFNPWEIFHPFTNPTEKQLRNIIDNWRTGFVELLSDIYQFGVRGRTILNRAIYNCYEKLGIYEGSNKYPLTVEIVEEIERLSVKRYSSMEKAKESIISTFQDLILINLDLSRRHGIPLEKLLDKCLILPLSGYSQEEQQLIIGMLYYWIYKYYFLAGKRNQGLKNLFLIDEAQLVLPAETATISKQPAIARYLALAREFGIGNFFLSQGKIHASALQNIDCYFLFRSSASDILEDISRRSLMLDTDQIYYQARGLNLGEFICVVKGRINEPIVVSFPEPSIDKGISDEEMEGIMQPRLEPLMSELSEREEVIVEKGNNKEEKARWIIDKRKLLEVLVANPFAATTEIYQASGLDPYRGNRAKKILVAEGRLEEHRLNLAEKRGGTAVYLEITTAGYQYLEELGIPYEKLKGKGSLEHKLWQAKILEYYKKRGLSAQIEGKEYGVEDAADVAVAIGNKNIAIEIELTITSHISKNVLRDLERYDQVIIATKKSLMCKINQFMLNNTYLSEEERVSMQLLTDFL